ncbi:antibiotic biosynthesis monooxygenase [Streptomyces sp. NBC_00487]|uniref:putative quinol monooxygenase n=1 Tax=unclassified Streptomyces TaxID=2593676 RepID=UPI002E17E1A0|nr:MULTISPECIES: putative quinol monooxygenase [unclassified Streptomyces]
MSIEITVLFDVVPDRLADTADAFVELCAATRQEEGALRFDAWRSEEHENVIVLVEEWADQAAIDLHMKEPYVADFLAKVEGAYVRPPYVHRLRPLAA